MALYAELKRRNVFRVGAAYLALAWVVVQITATVTPAFHLPESALPLVTWIGIVGFPCALIFSWAYELTPEGVKREREVDRSHSITDVTGKRLDYITSALVVAGIVLVLLDRLVLPRAEPTDGRAHDALLQENADGSVAGAGHARDQAAEGRGHGSLLQNEAASVPPDEKSIAVLPFVNMSSDKEQEYFSDGISEELLNLLAKISDLKVIARTSSFAFKGEKMEIADIAQRLHVAHVLEGSVRKAGNTVRITAQLIRAADSTHLWSETYDRPLDNIFAVQDEIAGAVVAQLKIALLGAAPTVRPVDPRVYPLILQAKALADQASVEGHARAIALYQQALAIAPDEPRAWSGLGRTYVNDAAHGWRTAAEGSRLATEAFDKALALDPNDALTHSRFGWLVSNLDNDLAAAAPHYQRALVLEPGNVGVITNAATYLFDLGRLDEAIALDEYATGRDPANSILHANLGSHYYAAGHWDQAIASLRTALTLNPAHAGAHSAIGQALLLKGDAAAALVELQAEPDEVARLVGVALAQHALGRAAESDAALAAVIARHAQDQAASIALVYAWRGETDRAFEWLDKAVANKEGMGGVILEPMGTKLHDDPRWLPLLRKLGTAPEQLAAIEFKVTLPR